MHHPIEIRAKKNQADIFTQQNTNWFYHQNEQNKYEWVKPNRSANVLDSKQHSVDRQSIWITKNSQKNKNKSETRWRMCKRLLYFKLGKPNGFSSINEHECAVIFPLINPSHNYTEWLLSRTSAHVLTTIYSCEWCSCIPTNFDSTTKDGRNTRWQ